MKPYRLINTTVLITLLSVILTVIYYSNTHAVSGNNWNPGNIISDEVLYKQGDMSQQDIQGFLESQIPDCDTMGLKKYNGTTRAIFGSSKGYPPPYTCLKDFSTNVPYTPSNEICSSIDGGVISAAKIIHEVSTACKINAKALIVMLEKEQSLVTDDWPWSIKYRSAMGYGCPDTAPCESRYFGLYNQVYNAAWQLRTYSIKSNSYRYKPFQNNFINYHWNSALSCGGSNVYIENYATAGLYNYTPYQPNASALSNLYGKGDGCSEYGNRNFWRIYNNWFGSTLQDIHYLKYETHIKNLGWTKSTINSGISGTTGMSLSMEAFRISGDIEYSSYNVEDGWQPTVNRSMVSGTEGQRKSIQALSIKPMVNLASNFNVYYRVHVSNIGWMGWAQNGEVAGVTGGTNYNIEAIQIRLVPLGAPPPSSTLERYKNISLVNISKDLSLNITSHISYTGWQPIVKEGMISGTTGQNRGAEAIKLNINNNTGLKGSVKYATHISGVGWQNFKNAEEISGSTGQSRNIESIRIIFTDELSQKYSIWYRVHIQDYGWSEWFKDGEPAGSIGISKRIEAIETRIAPYNQNIFKKGEFINPKNIQNPALENMNYKGHVSFLGWMNGALNGEPIGTTGRSLALEAIHINNISSEFGDLKIDCAAFLNTKDWKSSDSNSDICGSVGESTPIEAIRFNLSGTSSFRYNIKYKIHFSFLGWSDWYSNNETAGYPGSDKNIEAIILKIEPKI